MKSLLTALSVLTIGTTAGNLGNAMNLNIKLDKANYLNNKNINNSQFVSVSGISNPIIALTSDNDGNVYVVCKNNNSQNKNTYVVYEVNNKLKTVYKIIETDKELLSIAIDSNWYNIYLGSKDGNVYKLKFGQKKLIKMDGTKGEIRKLIISKDNLYVGSFIDNNSGKFYSCSLNGTKFNEIKGTNGGYVTALTSDNDGNVYVATMKDFKPNGLGFYKIKNKIVKKIDIGKKIGMISELTCDNKNNLYLSDTATNGIYVLKFNSVVLKAMFLIAGHIVDNMTVDNKTGYLYVGFKTGTSLKSLFLKIKTNGDIKSLEEINGPWKKFEISSLIFNEKDNNIYVGSYLDTDNITLYKGQ